MLLTLGIGVGCQGSAHVLFEDIVSDEPRTPTDTPNAGSLPPVPVPDAAPHMPPDDEPEDEDAGMPDADPDLDPSITFEWTETLPGEGRCGPAHYVGSFVCTVESSSGALPVGGQIRFDLEEAAEGALSIEEGRLSDLTGAFFSATLIGTVDCVTNSLSATTLDGQVLQIENIFLPTFHTFEAALEGTLNERSLAIEGELTMVNDAGELCRGTFRVGVAP